MVKGEAEEDGMEMGKWESKVAEVEVRVILKLYFILENIVGGVALICLFIFFIFLLKYMKCSLF